MTPHESRSKVPAKSPTKRTGPAASSRAGRSSTPAVSPVPAADDAPDEPASTRGESVARAYEQLREFIVWGRLAPGSRIVESEIAERLGVSRTPTRSALHRLQQEGYVTAVDRAKERRLIVTPLTRDDGRELFHVVGALEGLAARGAAELPAPERAALTDRLRRLNGELAEVARDERPDQLRLFDLDNAFHRAYVEAGAGARLLALHDATKPQAERYIRLYVSSLADEITKSVTEHDQIIRHLADGDPLAAQQAVDTNWRNAAERLSRVIGAHGERGIW